MDVGVWAVSVLPAMAAWNIVFHCPSGTPKGLPRWHSGKESTCHAGDVGSIPGLGRSLGAGNVNPFLYPCLENPMDRGAWQAIVHGVAHEWNLTERLTSWDPLCWTWP